MYKDVNEVDYRTFANDQSQGKALNSLIKGKYDYEQLEEPAE